MYYQSNNLKDAIEALKNALKIEHENIILMIKLGEFFRLSNKVNDSITILKKVTTLDPENSVAWANLGLALQQGDQVDEAVTSYKKSLDINPNSAATLSNLGAIAKKAGERESAMEYFEKALSIKPGLAEANNNLGTIFQELGRLDEAEASYRRAIKLKPDFTQAYTNLGNMLQKRGKLDEAVKNCRRAISLTPEYADAHNNLGVTLQALGTLGAAEESYKRAIELKPEFVEAHFNLGDVFAEMKRFEEAELSFGQALKLNPAFTKAHFGLGNMLKRLARYNEAEKSYAQAIKLEPNFIEVHNKLLTCLYLMNEESRFYDELDYLISQGEANAVTGSLTQRASLKYGNGRPNLFCKEPFKHVQHTNLDTKNNFEEVFIKNAKTILQQNRLSNKNQSLLVNGNQTQGNLFEIEVGYTAGIEKTIREAIEAYRITFLDSEEGLIKKWPTDYILYGWLISMKSGGILKPHIHEEGWLSGSVYINVPPKSKTNSGNLVVCLGEEKDEVNGRMNTGKILNVSTGSLALFPASMTHYTIPFESDEERIVLAFDVRKIEVIGASS
jgi:tetratricopeptide (TPR) repeat protein